MDIGYQLAETDQWDIWKMVVIGGFIVGGILLYKLIEVVGEAARVRSREQTKREVAAYVAEGSMTPETAEKLLACGAPNDWPEQVAQMVREGHIDSDEAEKLIKVGTGPAVQNADTRGSPAPARA